MLWKPIESFQLGLSYTSQAKIDSEGRAHGDAGVQLTNLGLGAARHDFAYDAEVTNVFPQQIALGLAWKPVAKLTVSAQVDWINWQNSFDKLEVRLRHGNNRDLNGLVASDKLDDDIPLDWKDQFVFRAGVEYQIDEHWALRAGYAYGRNPIPTRTLLPLTAAIMEHTISAGVGFRTGGVVVDLAYQWQIPNSEHIGESDLAAGEYSDSTIRVGTQWVGLTTSLEF
jgi:long-chain fatty acid transport protein